MPKRVTYQLRIVLMHTKPPIWRRVLVPPTMHLDTLHHLIQAVMGWEDRHLHMFRKGKERYSMLDPWRNQFRMPGTPRELDERKYRIHHLLEREGDSLIYIYDFGDSWDHKVTLQKILPYKRGSRLPACISGRRRCPPEDCGGVWGYEEMLESLADPKAEDHEHVKEWIGEDFDPEGFSAKEVDRELAEGDW